VAPLSEYVVHSITKGGIVILLKDKVKDLPSSPGVYLMKDANGSIIYVGKAKNLKNRVRTYFQNSKAHSQKVNKLKANIKDFEFKLTDTEFEAFILECKLIKEIKPFYNKRMKSPLSYTYLAIHMDKQPRRIEITNKLVEKNRTFFFGPYTSRRTVENAILGIKETYKILCNNPSNKNTACLNHSLGLCIGGCLGGEALNQYNQIIEKIIELLTGKNTTLIEEMQQTMVASAEKFDFETAAKYRDYIESINFLLNKEKVIEFTVENKNIVVIERLSESNSKLFLIKGKNILYSEIIKIDNYPIEQLSNNIHTHFNHPEASRIYKIDRNEIDESQIIYSYLKNSHSHYIEIPENWLQPRGEKYLNKELNKLLSTAQKSPRTQ
jgi:excinuclease ABC subunit C